LFCDSQNFIFLFGECVMRDKIALVSLLLLASMVGAASAVTYNANTDMVANVTNNNPALNPYGPWSYGYFPGWDDWVTGVHWFDSTDTSVHDGQRAGWNKITGEQPLPHVLVNYTGADLTGPLTGITKDMITLNPGQYGNWVEFRWTAPTAGTVDISSTFSNPLGTATAEVWMQKSPAGGGAGTGVDLFPYLTIDSTTPTVTKNISDLSVAVGDKIYVIVGYGSNSNGLGDTVGMFQTITYTPEPSSIAILGSAIVGLLCYAWRKRR
jgi:hypothetical protein